MQWVDPYPFVEAGFTDSNNWAAWCPGCRRILTISPVIGLRALGCCETQYLVTPPRSNRRPFRDDCPNCADHTEYAAVDLASTSDGARILASYQCDRGHGWTREWDESPGGIPLTFRKLRCAVYRHFDQDRVLLYIGISMRPVDRGKQHASAADWTEFAAFVEGVWYTTRAEAEAIELAAIKTELPVFNRKHAVGDQRQREADYLLRHGVQLSLFADDAVIA